MIPLGRLLCSGLILGGLCFPGWGWCEPPPSPAPPSESPVNPPASPQAASPSESAEETLWLPLREIIQLYSETTGNQVRIKDDKTFDQLYSVNDPSWLEDFSRIEILNEQTGKKEIILLGKHDGTGLKTKTARNQSRRKFSRPGTQVNPQQKTKAPPNRAYQIYTRSFNKKKKPSPQ